MDRKSFVLLLLLLVPRIGAAQWSEPTIGAIKMTAPLTPPPVTGTTRYVDKNSVGGPCNNANLGTSITAPKCSITNALTVVGPGDLVLVRAGTYFEGNLKPGASGTAGNYITIREYPGETAIIDCAGFNRCLDYTTAGARAFTVWDGFEMKNSTNHIVRCEGSQGCNHLWIINGIQHDFGQRPCSSGATCSTAVDFIGSSFNVVSNNECYNATNCYGGDNAQNNIWEFNHLHDFGADADDTGGIKALESWASVLRYNTVHHGYRSAATSFPCFNPGNCVGVAGLYIDVGHDDVNGTFSYVYNNIVHDADMGIEVWVADKVRVFNNLVYHIGFNPGGDWPGEFYGQGLPVGDNRNSQLEFYNNTVYDTKKSSMYVAQTPGTGLKMRNNIFMNATDREFFWNPSATNADLNYDLFFDVGTTTVIQWDFTNQTLAAFKSAHPTTEQQALSSNPLFVTAGSNFQLQTSSPAKDAGESQSALFTWDLNNVTRPQGSAWDLGAYEFVVAVSSPPTATITAPTSGTTYSTSITPLTTLAGSPVGATDDVGVTSVTWTCASCTPTSGTATCASCGAAATSVAWSVGSIGLALGPNTILVTAHDGDTQTGTAQLTVTYTPAAASGTAPFRLVR